MWGAVAKLKDLGAKVRQGDDGEVISVRLRRTWHPITDAGLVHLKELANLQYLLVGEAEITDSGIVVLQTALPNCEIIR